MDEEILFAGCHCGKVEFTAPLSAKLWTAMCHCTICQRLGGGIATILIGFEGGTQKFNPGSEEHVTTFASSSQITRKRCRHCGSPVSAVSNDGEWWDCPLGIFCRLEANGKDGKIKSLDKLLPECHMFYPSRVLNVFDYDSLPKWSTYPGVGEPMEICESTGSHEMDSLLSSIDPNVDEDTGLEQHPVTLVNSKPLDGTDFIAPYVPCPAPLIKEALMLVKVTSKDLFADLGCGDARICLAAKELGVKNVLGVELDPVLIQHIKAKNPTVKLLPSNFTSLDITGFCIAQCDLFAVNLSEITCMVLYLLPTGLSKLKPTLEKWLTLPNRRLVTIQYAIPNFPHKDTLQINLENQTPKTLYLYC